MFNLFLQIIIRNNTIVKHKENTDTLFDNNYPIFGGHIPMIVTSQKVQCNRSHRHTKSSLNTLFNKVINISIVCLEMGENKILR